MKVVDIPKDDSVKRALEEFTNHSDKFKGVILIGLTNDDAPFLMTSKINGLERSHMISFAEAFNIETLINAQEPPEDGA